MKKVLLLAGASMLFASPSMAAVWQGHTFSDTLAGYQLNAPVNTFCAFGTEDNQAIAGTNVTTANGAFSAGLPGADGNFVLDIQNDNDDTVQGAHASYKIKRAVCNTAFNITMGSVNGGLKSSNTTTDTDFTLLVPYTTQYNFDGVDTGAIASNTVVGGLGAHVVKSSSQATAGELNIDIVVSAMDKLLVKGNYSDIVWLTVVPTA